MSADHSTELFSDSNEALFVRSVLLNFERSTILEVYFARIDGRRPEKIPLELIPLYDIGLEDIKTFLLGQHPHDSILHKLFRIMN